MNQSGWNRWFFLSGIVFVVLFLVPGILVGGQVGFMPDGQTLIAFVSSNADAVYLAGYLGTLSTFFLLWFAGSLRGVLKGAAPVGNPLADIAFGGGVAAAHPGFGALSERVASAASIGPDAATTMIDTWGSLSSVALPIAFAALIAATGLALVRTKILSAWFGWASVILALALLAPFSWAVLTLILIWMVVISFWLFARMGREPTDVSKLATSTQPAKLT